MKFSLQLNELDHEIWEEELAEFVPSRIFDAHTHIYDLREEIATTADPIGVYGNIWIDWPVIYNYGQIDRMVI